MTATAPPVTGRGMRLLVDCHTFDAGPQGTTTFLAGVLNALPQVAADSGLSNIELICAAQSRAAVERFVHVPFRYAPMQGGFLWRNGVSLPRLCSEMRADWVISQYVRPFRASARTASVIHDVLFLDFPHLFGRSFRLMRQITFGWAARHSDAVMTVSQYSRMRIAHHFGVPVDKIDVVHNAVSTRFTSDRPTRASDDRDGPRRLLMVSRLERRKRQDWCVAAAQELALRGTRVILDLVGTGHDAYADEIRKLAAAYPEIVRLHESLDDDALVAMYAQADLFLFPSECEGFGIPVIEAAAMGLPCVVADNTALRELRASFVGPCFDATSPAALANAVETALDDLEDLQRKAQQAQASVFARFNWQEAARQLLASLARHGGAA